MLISDIAGFIENISEMNLYDKNICESFIFTTIADYQAFNSKYKILIQQKIFANLAFLKNKE